MGLAGAHHARILASGWQGGRLAAQGGSDVRALFTGPWWHQRGRERDKGKHMGLRMCRWGPRWSSKARPDPGLGGGVRRWPLTAEGRGRGGMRLPSGQHAPHQHLPSPARPHLFLFPPLNLLHTAVRTPLHPSSLLKRTADARTGKGAPRLRPPLGPRPCRDPGP